MVRIKDREDAAGDALLDEVCQAIAACYHQWHERQMLTWDNWRMLHCVTGTAPGNQRRMHRTTFWGDYGLGFFEGEVAAAGVG